MPMFCPKLDGLTFELHFAVVALRGHYRKLL